MTYFKLFYRLVLVILFVGPSSVVAPAFAQSPHQLGQIASGLDGGSESYESTIIKLRAVAPQEVIATSEKATVRIEDLRKGQLEWRRKIKSLHVTFTHLTEQYFKLSGPGNGSPVNSGNLEEIDFEMKGAKRYAEYKLLTDSNAKPKKEDGYVDTVSAFNGTGTRLLDRLATSAQIHANKVPGYELHGSWYTESITLQNDLSASWYERSPFFVPAALASPSYQVATFLDPGVTYVGARRSKPLRLAW